MLSIRNRCEIFKLMYKSVKIRIYNSIHMILTLNYIINFLLKGIVFPYIRPNILFDISIDVTKWWIYRSIDVSTYP